MLLFGFWSESKQSANKGESHIEIKFGRERKYGVFSWIWKTWKVSDQRDFHDCALINRIYDFYDECKRRYSIKLWKTFTDWYNWKSVSDSEFLLDISRIRDGLFHSDFGIFKASGLVQTYLVQTGSVGNRLSFGFKTASGSTPIKGNH